MTASLSAASFPQTTTQEALTLKRITEFWKDGDYQNAKKQITDFLAKHPDTSLRDYLHAMLGDLYFHERNFKQALATYALIQNEEIQDKITFNQFQALFELKQYFELIEKTGSYLKAKDIKADESEKVRFLLAESLFREALGTKEAEQKTELLKQAKSQYKILTQTKFADRVLFPLAETHRLLKEDGRAAAIYLELAKQFPQHEEKFLFQSAILQIKEEPKEAIRNFEKVYQMRGKRAPLAIYNKLILLYQTHQYSAYLAQVDEVLPMLPQEKAGLLKFYQGRCDYEQKNYLHAASNLEQFIALSTQHPQEAHTALLLIFNCAKELKDLSLLDRNLLTFKARFPEDPNVAKATMLHAQLCREQGDTAASLKDLNLLIQSYPHFDKLEAAYYDYALLLAKTSQWEDSRRAFTTFIELYPLSQKHASSMRHLVNCFAEELKNPKTANAELKQEFIPVLQNALKDPQVFTAQENEQYLLLLVKCQFELAKYADASATLDQYLNAHPEAGQTAEAHLLKAICHHELKDDPHLFINHAEAALHLNPSLAEKDLLHLELYNAYLSLSLSEQDAFNKHHLFEKAASHLFASKAWQSSTIKKENHLWLANFYYTQAKNAATSENLERAIAVYQTLLNTKDDSANSGNSIPLEMEWLKYAELLGLAEQHSEQISTLRALIHRQQAQPEFKWEAKSKALFELAHAYEKSQDIAEAKKAYQFLVNTQDTSSFFGAKAKLQLANLQYYSLKEDEKNLDNQEFMQILNALKDLQIQKQIAQEPIHLEAALKYAEIRAELADPSSKGKQKLFFLKRMKEDFTSNEDPVSQEYNKVRSQYPDKDLIYQNYLKFVDAEIFILEAKEAAIEQNRQKAHDLKTHAYVILEELFQSPDALRPYLYDRVKICFAELDNLEMK